MSGAQAKTDLVRPAGENEDEADIVIIHDEDNDDVWDDDEEPIISDEEVLEGFRDAVRELKLCLEGKHEMQPIENLFAELERDDEDE